MWFPLSWYNYSVCCSELSASQDFPLTRDLINFKNIPCIIARRVLTLSRYWALQNRLLLKFSWFLPQFSFVVPTVECICSYDIDLMIYSFFWTSQMFVLWWSPERLLKSLSLSCKNVSCFLSLNLLERSYSWGFPDTKAIFKFDFHNSISRMFTYV